MDLFVVAIKAYAIRFLYKPGCSDCAKLAKTNFKFQDFSVNVTSSFFFSFLSFPFFFFLKGFNHLPQKLLLHCGLL